MVEAMSDIDAVAELHKFMDLLPKTFINVQADCRIRALLVAQDKKNPTMYDSGDVLISIPEAGAPRLSIHGADRLSRASLPTRFQCDRHWMKCTDHALVVEGSDGTLVWIKPVKALNL